MFENIYRDMVVFTVKGTDLLFIAPYITPENSQYKNKEIFTIVDFIIKCFNSYKIFMIGDFNTRCGDPVIDDYT